MHQCVTFSLCRYVSRSGRLLVIFRLPTVAMTLRPSFFPPTHPITNTFTEIHARDLCAWVRILTRRHCQGSRPPPPILLQFPAQTSWWQLYWKSHILCGHGRWAPDFPGRAIQSGYNFMRNLNTQDMLILWRPNTHAHKQIRYGAQEKSLHFTLEITKYYKCK